MLIILVGIIFCGAGFRHGIDSTCSFCLPVRASVPPATFPYTVLVSFLPYSAGTAATFLSFSEYGTPLLPISAAAAAFHSSLRASSFLAAPMCDGSSNRVIDSMSRTVGIVPMSSPSVINNQHLSVRGEREQHGQRATDMVPRAAGCVERGAAGSSTTGPPRSPSHTLGESLCRTWSWTASTSRSPERTPRASAPCATRAAVSWTAALLPRSPEPRGQRLRRFVLGNVVLHCRHPLGLVHYNVPHAPCKHNKYIITKTSLYF
jgi:hypothetical protein